MIKIAGIILTVTSLAPLAGIEELTGNMPIIDTKGAHFSTL